MLTTDAAEISPARSQNSDPSPMSLLNSVEAGLPLAELDRVAKLLAPDDPGFPYRVVPKATLARRRKAGAAATQADAHPAREGRLSSEEGARVARLAEVWACATDVWGSDVAARNFLFRPHMLLDMRRPIDVVLTNEFGRPLVEGILGRLKYGTGV